jgi:hypothetical protein
MPEITEAVVEKFPPPYIESINKGGDPGTWLIRFLEVLERLYRKPVPLA